MKTQVKQSITDLLKGSVEILQLADNVSQCINYFVHVKLLWFKLAWRRRSVLEAAGGTQLPVVRCRSRSTETRVALLEPQPQRRLMATVYEHDGGLNATS